MYPIKFKNIYHKKVWGGRDFEKFRNNLIEGNIGESWDVACNKNGTSIVSNGKYKGKSLDEMIKEKQESLLGNKCINKDFPILIKLINCNDKLSIQVHPNDEYAGKNESQQGKTEAWYVIEAKPEAHLIIGTKDCDKNIFKNAIGKGETEKYLNKIKIKKGDCYLIPSGLVHAICQGVVIAEIQQNSDVTYRIYDYDRDRELHIEKSLDVIDFQLKAINETDKEISSFDGYKKCTLCNCDYFTIEKYMINGFFKDKSNPDKFFILTCVEGEGKIIYHNQEDEIISKGDSILIPAFMGEYTIFGNLDVLKSSVS